MRECRNDILHVVGICGQVFFLKKYMLGKLLKEKDIVTYTRKGGVVDIALANVEHWHIMMFYRSIWLWIKIFR
jgi:hypothetical protein